MQPRTLAAVIAAPLVLGLLATAAFAPLPFVTYKPGLTVDVLAKDSDEAEIIQVDGHRTYRDDGELRMTTVLVTPPEADITLAELIGTWFDSEDAVYPHDAVYPDDETDEQNDVEGAISMVTSQDSAIAAALRELDYDVEPVLQVAFVNEGSPAEGKLRVRDTLLRAGGERLEEPEDLVTAVEEAGVGNPLELQILRDRKRVDVEVTPTERECEAGDDACTPGPAIGIYQGVGFRFPFDVQVNISPEISGPSAGLMFSLAIYDTLTPGSLTAGKVVAGTGEITPEGQVGPIGGIQQKIAGAREAGAELFLVPPGNCDDVEGLDTGETRLMMAATLADARAGIEAWAADAEADLPTCADVDELLEQQEQQQQQDQQDKQPDGADPDAEE